MLTRRYQLSLFGLISHYVGDYHEAQVLLQEGWLQLSLSLGTLRLDMHIRLWIITFTRNRSLDVLRHKRLPSFSEVEAGNQEGNVVSFDEIPAMSPTPEDLAERRDLQQAIQTLPSTYRSVVLLHYGEQLMFSPDWTNSPHAKINNQDPIQSSQTDTTRCFTAQLHMMSILV
jgi:RNA polymerase sigma factor (sigma-70 family)